MATTQTTQASTSVEIKGQAVNSVVEGSARLAPAYGERALVLLDRHGVPEPRQDGWYDATGFQGAVEHIAGTAGPRTVNRIGQAMADLVEWAEDTDSVPAALAELDSLYGRLHRGGDVGTLEAEVTGERSATVTVRTPYPDAFDRGLLKGLGYRFSEGVPRVTAVDGSGSGATQVYELTW